MTSDFRVEPLAPADAGELAALHIRVWREAYAGMVSQDYLDGMQLEPRLPGGGSEFSCPRCRSRR